MVVRPRRLKLVRLNFLGRITRVVRVLNPKSPTDEHAPILEPNLADPQFNALDAARITEGLQCVLQAVVSIRPYFEVSSFSRLYDLLRLPVNVLRITWARAETDLLYKLLPRIA